MEMEWFHSCQPKKSFRGTGMILGGRIESDRDKMNQPASLDPRLETYVLYFKSLVERNEASGVCLPVYHRIHCVSGYLLRFLHCPLSFHSFIISSLFACDAHSVAQGNILQLLSTPGRRRAENVGASSATSQGCAMRAREDVPVVVVRSANGCCLARRRRLRLEKCRSEVHPECSATAMETARPSDPRRSRGTWRRRGRVSTSESNSNSVRPPRGAVCGGMDSHQGAPAGVAGHDALGWQSSPLPRAGVATGRGSHPLVSLNCGRRGGEMRHEEE
jgi:hypothetical protein